MEKIDEFIKNVESAELAVFDVDGVIVYGRIANSLKYLIEEERGNENYWRGILGGLNIVIGTRLIGSYRPKIDADNWGLKKAIETIGKAGIGKDRIQKASEKYYERKKIEGIDDLVGTLKDDFDLDIYISTTSADLFIEPLVKKIGAVGFTSQETLYNDDVPIGINLRIEHSVDKYIETLNDVKSMNYDLTNSVFFGDSSSDLYFKDNVKSFVASPLAKPEVRRVADLKLDEIHNYFWLSDELKNSAN